MPAGELENTPKRAQDGPKQRQERPKTIPRGAQEGQKSEPKPLDEKRSEPRRSQDRLEHPRGRFAQSAPPPGLRLGGQNATKIDPKTIQNRSEKSRGKQKRSKTILDPSWGDLGPSWVPSWADLDLKIVLSPSVALVFVKNHFFDVKTVRRRLWDQLWPTKAPKRPKMTPKTEPKSTPRRSKIETKSM